MKIQSLLYLTLLSSIAQEADQFDPNNLSGNSTQQRQQLLSFLTRSGVEASATDTLANLRTLALNTFQAQQQAPQAFPPQQPQQGPQPFAMGAAPQPQADPLLLAQIQQLTQTVAARDQMIQQHVATITDRERAIQDRDQIIQQHVATITDRERAIQDRDQIIIAVIAERDSRQEKIGQIKGKKKILKDQKATLEQKLQQLHQTLASHDQGTQNFEELSRRIKARELEIETLQADLEKRIALSAELDDNYQESLRSKNQVISELEQCRAGDARLIKQLEEQIRQLRSAQQSAAPTVATSSSSSSAPQTVSSTPPAPPSPSPQASPKKMPPLPPPPSQVFDRKAIQQQVDAERQAQASSSAAPSALTSSDIAAVKLRKPEEQKPLTSKPEEEQTSREGILVGIKAHTKKQTFTHQEEERIEKIKKEIREGKRKSAFYCLNTPADNPEADNPKASLGQIFSDALKRMWISQNQREEEAKSSSDDDWSDDETKVKTITTTDQQVPQTESKIDPELRKKLYRIRQIYRDALGIGYADDGKTQKWHPDRWLLWEDEHYSTEEQKYSIDGILDGYIRDNIKKLQENFKDIDFNRIIHRKGVPMASHTDGSGLETSILTHHS